MRKLIVIVCLAALSQTMRSQVVEGTVCDGRGVPISWANVVLLTRKDTTYVKGCVTDSLGRYRISDVDMHVPYLLHVSCIGYKEKWTTPDNARRIQLDEASQTLNEVVVKGQSSFFSEGKNGAIILHVAGTPLEHEVSSMDLLHQLPGILGTGDNLRTFIGGEPDVYINGKKVQSLNEVRQLAPRDIKTVTLNTNPNAEYSSSTDAVILITTKQKNTGWFFSGETFLKQNHKFSHDNTLTMGYNDDKLSVTGKVECSDYRRKNWQDIHIRAVDGGDIRTYWTKTDGKKWSWKELLWSLSIDYTLSQHHAFGLKYDGNFDKTIDRKLLPFVQTLNDTVTADQKGSSSENDISHRHYVNGYYKWKATDRLFGEVYLDYIFSTGNAHQYVLEGEDHEMTHAWTGNDDRLIAATLKQHVGILPHTELVFGEEYSRLRTRTHLIYTPHLLDNTDSRNTENKVCGFVSVEYHHPSGWSAYAGLREEYTRSHYDDMTENNDDEKRDYSTLLPSAGASWKTGAVSHSLTFGSSVIRPPFSILNGSSVYVNQFFYQEGNPKLNAQYNYRVQYDLQFHDLNVVAMYQYVRNSIQNVIYQVGASTIKSTFENIHNGSDLRLMVNWRKVFGPFTFATTSGYIQHLIKFPVDDVRKTVTHPQFYFRETADWTITNHCGMNVDYEYTGKSTSGFYETNEMHVLNARIYHTFYKDRLQLSLSVNDLLNKNRSYYHGTFDDITVSNRDFSDCRSVSLDFTWRINRMKKSYGGASASDDLNRL
ncbi:MAG: outer membrane beta-barrel protein [Prevotella sp.]|nr:outer membrane beta-barrel family protein [Prevotella sp.]MCH3970464.1 outer membrane beta-barrel protein [Prevotella sp.]